MQNRDYQRISQAVDYLVSHYSTKPSLQQLASEMAMSEYHLQRLFSQWVGLSPKRFMQYCTLQHAKHCLARSQSQLELAGDLGLSGPSRLYDLYVTLEAVTPEQAKSQGEGLEIGYGVATSPFGQVLIATTERGICHMGFVEDDSDPLQSLRAAWPKANLVIKPMQALAEQIFTPSEQPRALHLWVKGSNFQVQVWQALLKIPFGERYSYQQLAQQLGRPTASRAVANAVGRNQLAYLIPCHRVIRASGVVGGYRWGEQRKQVMLARESALKHA
ncbi:methylated-DNA--[protein]-cysteine S-methyltransferase [Aliagarivorans marinus]|uniref:methylated-DNA--[protein]-cysteine S-methyltransferase n=1 Tax=Aliagarivorans marinus TaxID=561965 RepID=UPI00041029B7|nr:methylated-DNA--[protein]-cysteine S-methyltransferase [Aliagarivorans marinus]